jgi:hypothetical protein
VPFVEIKKSSPHIKISNNGRVWISKSLYDKYFSGEQRIKIFHDEAEKKIGLQPSSEGYKLNIGSTPLFWCMPLAKIITGTFEPEWSEKHKMLIFSYK